MEQEIINQEYYYNLCVSKKDWRKGELKRALDFIRAKFADGKTKDMLEVGSGVSDIVPHLPPGLRYSGLDPVVYCIEESKKAYPMHTFKTGFAEKLPFNSNAFDLVFSYQTIQGFTDPRMAFSEIMRVVRPKGYIVVVAPNLECPWGRINAVRHYSSTQRLLFTAQRFSDLFRRFLGLSAFRVIKKNYVEAIGRFEKGDDDLRYVTSAWEIARLLISNGFKEVDSGKTSYRASLFKDKVKLALTRFGALKYWGGGMFLIFKKP